MLIQLKDEVAVQLLEAIKMAIEESYGEQVTINSEGRVTSVGLPEALTPHVIDPFANDKPPAALFTDAINDKQVVTNGKAPEPLPIADTPDGTVFLNGNVVPIGKGGLFPDLVKAAAADTVEVQDTINSNPVAIDRAPVPAAVTNDKPPTINDKQWSALLNAGISHGMSIDKVAEMVRLVFNVPQIKELPAASFTDALDVLSGKTLVDIERLRAERAASKKSGGNGFAEQAEAVRIDGKQWSNILNAGCVAGIGIDGTDALIKQKYNCRTRDLKQSQFEEALNLVKTAGR